MRIALCLFLIPVVLGAQTRDREREKLEQISRPLVEDRWIRCAVVGLVDQHGQRVYGFGKVGEAPNDAEPDGDTLFEIGSVSKTFTALLVAQMSLRGQISLDDELSRHLPANVQVPRTDQPITLLRLATHHSGLPRMPTNFAPADPANPYADYDAQRLYDGLSTVKVHPVSQYEYSNLGYALLGHVIERVLGRPYETVLQGRICDALGMKSTMIALNEQARARLAPPFDADLVAGRNWDLSVFAGAGAIRSTASDMLKYLAAQAGLRDDLPAGLAAAIKLTHEARDSGPGEMRMGLGWHVTRDGKLFHNGQTGGYHAFAMVDLQARRGVIVLCNTASMRVDEIGGRAMRILAGLPVQNVRLPKIVKLDAIELDAFAGRYVLPDASVVTVLREQDHLLTMSRGSGAVRIYSTDRNQFIARSTHTSVTFETDAGAVSAMSIVRDGKTIKAIRSRS